MNALIVLLLIAGIIYGMLFDGTFWKIYAILVSGYLIFVLVSRDTKENPNRKTIMISSWDCKYFKDILIIMNSLICSFGAVLYPNHSCLFA